MLPEKVFKIGPNSATIFRNQYGYNVNVQRRYKDNNTDQWNQLRTFDSLIYHNCRF